MFTNIIYDDIRLVSFNAIVIKRIKLNEISSK